MTDNRILIVGCLGELETRVMSLLAEAGHNVVIVNSRMVLQTPPIHPGAFMTIEGGHRTDKLKEAIEKLALAAPEPPIIHEPKRKAQWKDEVHRWPGKRR